MLNRARLVQQLTEHEGLRLHPYRCTEGKLTIGVGRNLEDKGITKAEARYLLANDINEVEHLMEAWLPWVRHLSDNRQLVLFDMAFQMGIHGLLKFKKTLRHVKAAEYAKAADEMLDSKWAEQTPTRAKKLSEMMRTG